MLNKFKRHEPKLPEIKGILKHYRITHVLRDPSAPLPQGRCVNDLVFHVRYVTGNNGKPVKPDEYLTYDAVAKTAAFKEYSNLYLTPRIGRAVGVRSDTQEEIISFADDYEIQLKHERYMDSIRSDMIRKRKSQNPAVHSEQHNHELNVKKFRHCTSDNDCALSIKSEPVIRELNERFATQKIIKNEAETTSLHPGWLTRGNPSKSSLITMTSVSTIQSVFEPKPDTENNVPPIVLKKEKRPAPPPPLPDADSSFQSIASTSNDDEGFNDSFGANGTPFNGHRPSEPPQKRNSLCCVM